MFIVLFTSGKLFAGGSTGSINITVTGFKDQSGKAGISLFSGNKGFPDKVELAVKKLFTDIDKNSCTVVFNDIPYGTYAVSVFHDENSNSILEANMIGIPKEGVGASNNAKSRFGPPKYKDASFVLDSKEKLINIAIQYIKK